MSVAECKQAAIRRFDHVRRGINIDFELSALRKRLADGGLALADIGTSEEELASLRSIRS